MNDDAFLYREEHGEIEEPEDDFEVQSWRVHKNYEKCNCSGYPETVICNIKLDHGYSCIKCSPQCPLEEVQP